MMEKLKTLSKSLKPIKLLMGLTVGIIGLILGVGDLYQRYSGIGVTPKIILEFSPPSPVAVGTKVVLGYRLPDYGYFSLWNIDGQGKIYRVLPNPIEKMSSIKLNINNHTGFRKLQPDIAGAKEEMLLLWTKQHSNHPPETKYISEATFRHYLTLYPNKWVKKKATLQIDG